MITKIANLNADTRTGSDWRYLLAHDVTVEWREAGGHFIEHGKLTREREDDFAMAHNGLRYRYAVAGLATAEINPGDTRLMRLAHRNDRCRLCAALSSVEGF